MATKQGRCRRTNARSLWMANLAVSLLVLTLVLISSCLSLQLPSGDGKLISRTRRDTNPPFPVYSDEAESTQTDDDIVTTSTPSPGGLSQESQSQNGNSESQGSSQEDEKTITTTTSTIKPHQKVNSLLNTLVRRQSNTTSISSTTTKPSKSLEDLDKDVQPTKYFSSWEDDGERSFEELATPTYASLLSPLPTRQSSTTPFSSLLMNKTSRHYANSNANNANNHNHNANMNLFRRNNNAIITNTVRVSESSRNETNGSEIGESTLRGVRPTSSVMQFNPNIYNRVVKRRKITSISGKNRSGGVDFEVPHTTVSSVEAGGQGDELPSATEHLHDDDDLLLEAATTIRTLALGPQNSSRAIAGFSKKGPVRIVTKTRPKPIIIRDHEAYFRNLTTEMATTTENSLGEIEEDTQPPTVSSPLQNNNLLAENPHHHPNNMKVRKVKVTMGRRPGPGIVGTVTSDLPVEAVTQENNVTSTTTTTTSTTTTTTSTTTTTLAPPTVTTTPTPSPPVQEANNNIPNHIRPSPSSSTPEVFTSRRVSKEEFGIERDSYGDHHEDEDGFPSTMEEDDHQDDHSQSQREDSVHFSQNSSGGDMDVAATTEYSIHIPNNRHVPGNDNRFGNFKFEGSGSGGTGSTEDDENASSIRIGHVRVSTPKYRDYFSEVPTGGGNQGEHVDSYNKDNLNHLYVSGGNGSSGNDIRPSPSPFLIPAGSPVGVTATKTVKHNEDITPTPTPSYNVSNIEFQIPAPNVEANSHSHNQHDHSSAPLSTSPTITSTPTLPFAPVIAVSPPRITNSVEEHENSNRSHPESSPTISTPSSTPGPKISSKDVTSVFYTKVEEPHFTSSSYEYSTTKEYSYTSNSHHDPDDHNSHSSNEHGDDYENSTTHPPENSAAESQFQPSSRNSTSPPYSPTPFLTNSYNLTTKSTTTSTTATAAPSSQIPVVIPSNITKPEPSSISPEHDISATNIPEISHNDISLDSQEKNNESSSSNKKDQLHSFPVGTKGLPTVIVPALYQFPVLVKMELQLAQQMFCSNLNNFKEMIVLVYGEKNRGIVNTDQIVIYVEPNCTSDIVPTEDPSKDVELSTVAPALLKSTTLSPATGAVHTTSTTPLPTPKVTPSSAKNDSSSSDKPIVSPSPLNVTDGTTVKTGNKSISLPTRRRKRRSPQRGESLILDNKKNFEGSESSRTSGRNVNLSRTNASNSKAEEFVSVYFYVKDKDGDYDQELTMAFYEYWNNSMNGENGNASHFQGVFYQRVKKVDMVSASQLVSAEDSEANENSGIIAAIAIASIAAASLFLIGVLLLVLRHRQSLTKFAKRCTPVTLDDYSLDNISFSNSFRRKQRLRGSKRSYTNAAFDDHTAPSRVVNTSTLHSALTDSSGLDAEFRAIPCVSPTLDDIPQGAETKNRYANVIPMPDTRVLLTFQEEQPNSDYINANFVRGQNGEQKRYIITQGPLEETVVDFWRLIWEQQVRVIFMLTDFAEAGHPKCAEYYPRSETIDCSQLHGDFQVTLEKRDITDNFITSYLVIKDMERNLRRDVIHLWYCSWPEKGVPPTAKPTVDFLLKSRKFTKEPTPVVVHCSPGTGRSGTLVACDIAMKEFELHQKVDIPRLVLRLRQDRAGSVQTKEQYLHIYESLHYYATRYAATQMDPIGSIP